MTKLLPYIAVLLTLGFAVLTLLPIMEKPHWWIRVMDFPRIHYLVVLAPLLGFVWWALPLVPAVLAVAVLLGCGGYQVFRVLPYTPLAAKELRKVEDNAPGRTITAMSINVLMENDEYDTLAQRVREHAPDVLFLMETDARWVEELEPLLAEFDHVRRHPKDNHYGLVFATNLDVVDSRVEYLTVDDTPSLFAELRTKDGTVFRFIGLHPRPPTVGVDTELRDDQLYYAARFARESDIPVVVIGDFNAVAWSHPAREFKRVGEYLDARVGRGPLPSFDAKRWLMRFPIDQLYVTSEVALVDFARAEPVGSDHFPIIARLRIDPEVAAANNLRPNSLSEAELKRVEERIARHRTRLDGIEREVLASD